MAFYGEFPCLRQIARPSRVEAIHVLRVDRPLATNPEHGRFFLFDNQGCFMCKSRLCENIEEAIMRVGGQDCVGLVVERRFPMGVSGGGFYCPGWLSFLLGEGYTLNIYKMPKDFRIDDLRAERSAQVAQEVREEIKNA